MNEKRESQKSQQVTQRNVNGVGVGVLQVPGAQQVPLPLEDMACPRPPPAALVCPAVLPGTRGRCRSCPLCWGGGSVELGAEPSVTRAFVCPVLRSPFTLATFTRFTEGGSEVQTTPEHAAGPDAPPGWRASQASVQSPGSRAGVGGEDPGLGEGGSPESPGICKGS